MSYTIAAHNTGDCGPEQIYGEMDPPIFATEAEAKAAAEALLPGARAVAYKVWFEVIETEGKIDEEESEP